MLKLLKRKIVINIYWNNILPIFLKNETFGNPFDKIKRNPEIKSTNINNKNIIFMFEIKELLYFMD